MEPGRRPLNRTFLRSLRRLARAGPSLSAARRRQSPPTWQRPLRLRNSAAKPGTDRARGPVPAGNSEMLIEPWLPPPDDPFGGSQAVLYVSPAARHGRPPHRHYGHGVAGQEALQHAERRAVCRRRNDDRGPQEEPLADRSNWLEGRPGQQRRPCHRGSAPGTERLAAA
jgi:hypothetical protein